MRQEVLVPWYGMTLATTLNSCSQSSGVAWILPEVDGREFQFEVLSLSGGSHLAVVLESDSDSATLDVKHSKGDQTGTFHVGPHQDLEIDLPPKSPRLAWSIHLYPRALLTLPPNIEVYDMTLELDSKVEGMRNLTIGTGGVVYLRPYSNLTEELVDTISFDNINIRGGGRLVIEGDRQGLNLVGSTIHLESGGILEADHVTITADDIIIAESAILDLTAQVLIKAAMGAVCYSMSQD
ncbi:hypothetical protein BSL78_29827 [Apostichopus japonicus]|uniref:Uncharacterized protein n=1 Tax=Stichopus japonicus TaxID=307972 RepID=A0A2G8JC87_STIJA|nr:hypothetical protein BSL78_29827 [Apostichopus japonicus]